MLDAEEITQNVWMTFLEILPRFEGRSQARTILFGILYRKAAEARRQAARAVVSDPDVLDSSADPDGKDAEARSQRRRLVARSEIVSMPFPRPSGEPSN